MLGLSATVITMAVMYLARATQVRVVQVPAEQLRLQGFAYALDFGNSAANSSLTTGVKASGKAWVGLFQVAYNATYTHQTDYNGNTPDYALDYWGGDLAGTFDIWTVKASYESLEGNGTRGFTTPLATTHAFQGWSDAFVQPLGGNKGFVDGLEDANLSLNVKPRWRWTYLFNVDVLVRYQVTPDGRYADAARKPGGKGRSPATVNRFRQSVTRFFTHAAADDHADDEDGGARDGRGERHVGVLRDVVKPRKGRAHENG